MRTRDLAMTLALCLAAAPIRAQDAAAQGDPRPGPVDPSAPLPPGHPAMGTPTGHPTTELPPGHPATALPPGHPATGGTPAAQQAPALHRADLPRAQVEERDDVPPGVLVVQVVDAQGSPVPEAMVRLGQMRGGEPGPAQELRASPNGVVRFEHLATGQEVAYRVSTDRDGARFSAPPFQLSLRRGSRAQLVRYDVSRDPRGTLLWDARFELHFRDERLTVVQRMRIVNLTAMSIGGGTAEPRAFAPQDGVRFRLPRGFTAFQTPPMMADVRLESEGDFAVLRGALAPTTEAPLEVVFQYQLKLHGGDFTFEAGLPLPVVSATVASEGPPGLTLTVAGMPAAQANERGGDRILVTGLERRPTDPALTSVRVSLGGIPRAAGPMRTAATAAAALLVLSALAMTLGRGRKRGGRTVASLDAERDRVLAEAHELAKLRASGEVGPVTYARRRRELAIWLASLLKERDDVTRAAKQPEAPATAPEA